MSDSGMAMTGTITARRLPRNRKITPVTISSASTSVLMTSRIEVVTNMSCRRQFLRQSARQLRCDVGQGGPHPLCDLQQVRIRAALMPMKTASLPLKATL